MIMHELVHLFLFAYEKVPILVFVTTTVFIPLILQQMKVRHGLRIFSKIFQSVQFFTVVSHLFSIGNTHIASLLAIDLPNPYVWDFLEPHTPPRIKLGLQTPRKQHLVQSSFNQNRRKLNTFRTPRPIRSRRL